MSGTTVGGAREGGRERGRERDPGGWVDPAGRVEGMRASLALLDPAALDDAARLELLRSLEDLTRSTAALAARAQVAFAASQVAGQASRGVPVRRRGLAVADDLATARKTSPYWGSRELTSARALVSEMPRTLDALEIGTISAYQARLVTEATTCLDPGDRAEVDRRLEGALGGASNAEIGKTVRALVYEVDPAGFVARARKAAKDRGVSSRPAPDVMAVLSARLPAPQAVACYKALREHALAASRSGDPRTLNQLMADTLVERLTGRSVVDGIDVEVGLLITDAALFGGTSDAADLEGYGPVPAQTARDLLGAQAQDDDGDPAGTDSASAATAGTTAPGTTAPGAAAPSTDAAQDGAEDSSAAHPPTLCPDGPRCSSWSCDLTHGAPPPGATTGGSTGGATGGSTGESTDGAERGSGVKDQPATSNQGRPESQEDTDDSGRPPGRDDRDHPGARAAKVWLRRLYADPVTDVLSGRDSRRRNFTGPLRAFLVARDRTCRNAWCGAPVRDIDHIHRRRDGGLATEENGRGLCRRCNLARERERFRDPPPQNYRPPPPAMYTLTGRPPRAPSGGTAALVQEDRHDAA